MKANIIIDISQLIPYKAKFLFLSYEPNHNWWEWSSIIKVLKVTSLQYLYNISEMKLGMEFIFCMQINIKVSKSWHYRFWWKWLDMFKVPKVLLLWCKIFRYFAGVQSCLLLLVKALESGVKSFFDLVLHPFEIWGPEDKLDN